MDKKESLKLIDKAYDQLECLNNITDGKTETMPCVKHSFAWSGSMPCTGMYKCVLCGKPEDENSFNGKGE